jgi:ABC-2 type transport system permease protein
MLPSVLARTARDQRRSLAVWAVALAVLVAMYVAVYPSVKGNSSFAKLINEMPKAYRALFSVTSGADFTTAAGYLNTELLSFMGPLLVLVYAIGAGSTAVAGEEDRHTLDLLLANPLSPGRVVVEKFVALVGGVALLMGALWVALIAEGALAGLDAPIANAAAAAVHLGALGVEFGALALLVGALSGHLGASRAVPGLVAVLSYLVNGFGQLVAGLRPLRPFSPFYAYNGHDPLRTGVWVPGLVVLTATTAVLVGAAAAAFSRRDIRA